MNRDTINAIAEALKGTAETRYTDFREQPDYSRFLIHASGISLYFSVSERDRKIEISGLFPTYTDMDGHTRATSPYDVNEASPRISVSLDKTPQKIAGDITRRLLPPLLPVWNKVSAFAQRKTREAVQQVEACKQIAAIINGRASQNFDAVYGASEPGRISQIYIDENGNAKMRLTLDSVTIAELEAITKLRNK